MSKVRDVMINGSGGVSFNKKVDGATPRTETQGNVTVNYAGSPSVPAHYEVIFNISAVVESEGAEEVLSFQVPILIADDRDDVPYRTVESKAAQQIAPILRSVADQIERQVAEFDRARAEETDD